MKKRALAIAAAGIIGLGSITSVMAEPGGNDATGPQGEPGGHTSCQNWGTNAQMFMDVPADSGPGLAGYIAAVRDFGGEVGNSGHGVWNPNHEFWCEDTPD